MAIITICRNTSCKHNIKGSCSRHSVSNDEKGRCNDIEKDKKSKK